MAPKRKATGKTEEEPAAKEAKTEETKAEPAEEPAEAEPKEKETDDKKDSRAAIKETICFYNVETTLNVVPTAGGKVLMALSDGGMQFLIAGARANVGITAGRYFYEVKVIEALTPLEGRNQGRGRVPMPRQLVRLGFSLAGSSLVLGGGTDGSVCFDSEGFFCAEKKRSQISLRFGRDQAIGVLLNLDAKSPNANTISLFCNGQRISEPQLLPENFRGQPLFPHVAFRNVSLQVNFGPTPIAPLPFKCRMLQEAAKDDLKEAKVKPPKDGKYEVLFPVAFPDEGTFDWLDSFLEKNPQYVELSDRKIQDWAVKSGIWKPRSNSWKHSNDKPDYNFGIQFMDDFSIRRAVNSITSVVPRNYVIMEVKQNLTRAERTANLKRFNLPHFKKVAQVVMGEPTPEYKEMVHKKILEEKQAKAEMDWKMRKLDKERKKAIALRQKEAAAPKVALEAKQVKEEKEKVAEGDKSKEEGEEKKEAVQEEKKEEVKEEEKPKQEVKEEEKKEEEEEPEEPMPQAELTEEEKKLSFRQPVTNDLTTQVLNAAFDQFCIPEKDEGFDEIRFAWQNEENSKAYLKKWVLERKITSRIEDLAPSEWFKTKVAEFQKANQEWQAKLKQFKESKKGDEKKPAADGEDKKENEEEMRMDVDIFSVENICDVGNGEPLFSQFTFEDWTLLNLRFELHLLQAAFKKDVKDPERIGIHESHLLFYYSRYFRKALNAKAFGKETPTEVVQLVKETVKMDPQTKVLVPTVAEEPESLGTFVKMQEENRRKRQQRIDAGDETARLNFGQPQIAREQDDSWLARSARGPPIVTPTPSTAPAAAGGGLLGATSTPRAPAQRVTAPFGTKPAGGGPRLVPAPRAQGWQPPQQQQQQQQTPSWQGGKAGGGRWQQYAPRLSK